MAEQNKIGWDVVRALIAHHRGLKGQFSEITISTEKRGVPPLNNVYGILAEGEKIDSRDPGARTETSVNPQGKMDPLPVCRIALANRDVTVRAALKKVFQKNPGFEVVEQIEGGNEPLNSVNLMPDLVVFDAEAYERILTGNRVPGPKPEVPVGSDGFAASPQLSSRPDSSQRLKVQDFQAGSQRKRRILSPRRQQILVWIAEGKTSKEIADLLGITTRTVEHHRAAIRKNLGAKRIADLVRYSIAEGLSGKSSSEKDIH
jgi:DNA-binding NarL/FixJ family response regulator